MQGRVVVCMSRSANVFGCSVSTAADLLGGTMMVGWRRGLARHGQPGVVKCSADERMERGNLTKGMHEMKALYERG